MVEIDEEGAETEAPRQAGRQSSKKRRANTAACWKHYSQPFKHSDGNRYVKCKLCEPAFNLKFSGGTSNMIKHLRARHKHAYKEDLVSGEMVRVGSEPENPTTVHHEVRCLILCFFFPMFSMLCLVLAYNCTCTALTCSVNC